MLKNKELLAIIRRMAVLLEQRNMVRALVDYHMNVPLSSQNYTDRLIASQSGAIPREDLIKYCVFHPILISDKNSIIPNENNSSREWAMDRRAKIQVLFDSCLKDGLIQPIIEEIDIPKPGTLAEFGMMPTSKGTDLLQFIGFIKIWLEKYNVIVVIITGSIGLYILRLILNYCFGINIP